MDFMHNEILLCYVITTTKSFVNSRFLMTSIVLVAVVRQSNKIKHHHVKGCHNLLLFLAILPSNKFLISRQIVL